ncbi:MAG: ABC transporter permease [Frankiaceae bacterium]|nr:ABC transporter permease [Frankiaceae bacterium]
MLRFLARRLVAGVLVLFVISVAVFVLFFVVAPGEPAANFVGRGATPEQIEMARVRYGLDKPAYVQYLKYAGGLLHGDLGFSFRNAEPVTKTLLSRLPATASLAAGAAVLWLAIGIPVGILAATRPRSLRDRAATVFSLGGLSTPTFVIGLVLLYVLFYRLILMGWHLFPGNGYVPLTSDPFGWAQHLLLPWVTLAVTYAASYSRLVRGSLLEVLGEDYIRTARAKGLSERRVVLRHGLRSALTPVVTLLGIDLGSLLGGAIVTEAVFGLQGIGQTAVQAVTTGDLPIIFGTVMFAAFFVVVGNLVVDVAYATLDVRVRAR